MATVKRGNELLRLKYMRDDLVAKTAKAENADERKKNSFSASEKKTRTRRMFQDVLQMEMNFKFLGNSFETLAEAGELLPAEILRMESSSGIFKAGRN